MGTSSDSVSMAVFCDFENVALGVRDAKYDKFDIKPILERLLLKGSIVVKKAYCDWERYKGFKATMHEANFELIEIPHVRQSGKNSADIRLVVDALDLCYTKSHVNTFVIVSGDSDFSPLVSKLRENAKQVIGVGVKQSTSDLLIANCDEFIFYDDLVRENQRKAARRDPREHTSQPKLQPEVLEARRNTAIELAVETLEALASERGDSGKIWASVLKEAIKRRKPDFNESYFGFRAFGNLLEEAQNRGLLEVGRDEKSNTFVQRTNAAAPLAPAPQQAARTEHEQQSPQAEHAPQQSEQKAAPPRRNSRRGRGKASGDTATTSALPERAAESTEQPAAAHQPSPAVPEPAPEPTAPAAKEPKRPSSRARKPAAKAAPPAAEPVQAGAAETKAEPAATSTDKPRARRPRKSKQSEASGDSAPAPERSE